MIASVIFTSPCILEILPEHDRWRLAADFKARLFYDDGTEEIVIVPVGFVTDLASVPRFPAMYMLFGGKARQSSVLHDWLYSRERNREFADEVFYAAMQHEEGSLTRALLRLGVRLGGWTRYVKPTPPPEQNDY